MKKLFTLAFAACVAFAFTSCTIPSTGMENSLYQGECVLVIEGRSREELRQEEVSKWEEMSVEAHMEHYLQQGVDKKEAMKQVAKDRGVSKRDIYQQLL